MNIAEHAPSIVVHGTNGLQTSLDAFRGQWIVLYFYPKDSTPGCTLEGQDFSAHYLSFQAENAVVLGVSRDNLTSHDRFKTKHNLAFELISDVDEQLCKYFDVIKIKSMYGKQVRGIERSTFIIDPQGIVKYVWRGLRVKGHVLKVLETLQTLKHVA